MIEPNNDDLTFPLPNALPQHDPRFAKHADRNLHLFDGKIVAEGELPLEEMMEAP